MAIGIGISIANNRVGTSAPSLGSTMATTHYNRVIADGGVVPAGISGLTTILDSVISAYGATSSTDFNTKVPVFLDPHYTGYKLGAGSGTTLGQAARTVYAISSTADVTQATAASQPLLLAHSGVNYWWISGDLASNCTTPNAAANQITGDIEMIYRGSFDNNPSGNNLYLSKWESSGISYFLGTNNVGNLRAGFNIGGTSQFASSSVAFATNVNWYKVTRVASTGVVTFYQSTDNTSNINSVNWTQLGTTIITTAGNITSVNSVVAIYRAADQANRGKCYRATISNSIGGAPVVDFNPSSYSASTSQTNWTSTTGEVWTINTGTATTGYKGVLVDRTVIQGDGIDDCFYNSTFAISSTGLTEYIVRKKYTSTSISGVAIVLELSTNTNTQQGICLTLNEGTDTTYNSIRGDIAKNSSTFNDSSTNLLLSTAQQDVSQIAANETAYYAINNIPLTRVITGIGNNTAMSSIGLYIMARGGVSIFANIRMNTIIMSSSADNSTVRTTLYNTIRSMSNNAF